MRDALFFGIFLFFVNPLFSQMAICEDTNNDNICDFSEYIHVDQFGYLRAASKVAVISDPQMGFNSNGSFTPSNQLQVRSAIDDAVVYSGAIQIWNNGATHPQSGDKGWWFDFSSVGTVGEYFIYDPVQEVRSSNFKIGDAVYGEVLKSAMKMFYYNRCNATKEAPYAAADWTDGMNFTNTLQDANCRYVYDQGNAGLEKDLTGGWFDAGDYNKYVTFANRVIHDLLWAYKEHPEVFGDDWNIPESGNGIPDILDEIKWELEWLLKMTNADGSVHIKMGSISHSENISAPPSLNTDQRYYGPTCTSAAIANASMFAHAAKVFQQYPSMSNFANTLEANAVSTWNHVLPALNNNNLDENCDDGTIKAGDADWSAADQKEYAVAAAVYLLDLTGEDAYNQYVVSHVNELPMLANTYWDVYKMPINDAILHYTTMNEGTASVATQITTSYSNAASNNWSGYFGWTTEDLYRSHMPTNAYHWGSNLTKAGYGILNNLLLEYGINSNTGQSYAVKAAEQIHYFHGVNPLGLVYLSNMYSLGGDRCVNEMYHTWFNNGTNWDNVLTSLGPPPGYVVGGANKDFSIASISPPAGQPAQKSYLDWNTGWPQNSWEISEPAIYYQSSYIRLLASQVVEISTSNSPEIVQEDLAIVLLPNPTKDQVTVQMNAVANDNALVSVYSADGKELLQKMNFKVLEGDNQFSIPLLGWNEGMYFVKFEMQKAGGIAVKKLVIKN